MGDVGEHGAGGHTAFDTHHIIITQTVVGHHCSTLHTEASARVLYEKLP